MSQHGPSRAVDHLTCWGDHRLNLRRVDAKSLEVACGNALSPLEVAKIISVRNDVLAGKIRPPSQLNSTGFATAQKPMDPVLLILQSAGIKPKAGNSAANSGSASPLPPFTMESTCHSLWIVAHHKLHVRYDLSVVDRSDKERTRGFSYFQ